MIVTEKDFEDLHEEMSMKQGLDEKLLERFGNEQPFLTVWLLEEEHNLLTEAEQDYMFFLAMCIYEVVTRKTGKRVEVDGDAIREAEERNWGLLENSTAKTFRDRMTVFFEDSEEEDILAFIEDSIVEDDDDSDAIVSKIGREPIFVALKSLTDVLVAK